MNAIWKDKLLRLYLILFLLGAFCTSVMATLSGITDASQVRGIGWVMIVCSIIGNCVNTILAFINKNASKLEQGILPYTPAEGSSSVSTDTLEITTKSSTAVSKENEN